jgi:Na+/proline symporter
MQLSGLDWAIIAGYFVISLAVGLAFSRRAGRSLADFFVSGRSLPWWLAGTSMVATTFAADTPLAVTGLVAKHGLAGNWLWWAYAFGGMVTVFVYTRLWRRAEVLTDVELVELRYGGPVARFLRGFRAVYLSLLVNAIIIGWVTGAMLKVLRYTVLPDGGEDGISDWAIILIMLAVVGLYSTLSGMWGVAITDFLQFLMAMGGCIALAVLAVGKAGGMDAMRGKVVAGFPGGEQAFAYIPDFTAVDPWMPVSVFLVLLFVQWWATWYPGAEPGGGGYVVQRVASCKDERHALLATLWFQVAHYCLRPWPWLLVAFAALALYPDLRTMEDPGVGFPMVIRDFAPVGLRGLLLVTFFAAFMSTISTQVNWGASYLASDLYARFLRPGASAAEQTWAGRGASVLVLVVGAVAAWIMRSISVDQAWRFLAAMGAGTGGVFMLRWFWWRINAWSELTAMVASLVFFVGLAPLFKDRPTEHHMATVAGLTIVAWLVVTLLTPPESPEVLERFWRKVRPSGPGWRPVVARLGNVTPPPNTLGLELAGALLGAAVIYLVLPGVGWTLFGEYGRAALALGGAAVCAVMASWVVRRLVTIQRTMGG